MTGTTGTTGSPHLKQISWGRSTPVLPKWNSLQDLQHLPERRLCRSVQRTGRGNCVKKCAGFWIDACRIYNTAKSHSLESQGFFLCLKWAFNCTQPCQNLVDAKWIIRRDRTEQLHLPVVISGMRGQRALFGEQVQSGWVCDQERQDWKRLKRICTTTEALITINIH